MSMLQLRAADGHTLDAWLVRPEGTPRGAIVVVQEIFGVNSNIRRIVEVCASQGYLAIAPSMFDRQKRGLDLPYTAEGVQQGIACMNATTPVQALDDMRAAVDAVAHAGRIGVVGYCWGGYVAALKACRGNVAAAVAYYGGGLPRLLSQRPACPLLLHFGEQDSHIPLSDVDQVRKAWPEAIVHLYPAGHGFACPDRADFEPASARLAGERSLEFFRKHVG
jgi:carboxymethylenebutenolidase